MPQRFGSNILKWRFLICSAYGPSSPALLRHRRRDRPHDPRGRPPGHPAATVEPADPGARGGARHGRCSGAIRRASRSPTQGRLLLPEAQRILADVAALEARMAQAAQGLRGTLSMGFTSSAAAHAFTPETLRACRERYPDIELVLSEHNAAEITEAVASRRLHCGFLRVPVARPPGLLFETLLTEPVVVALPIDHRLARGSGRSSRTGGAPRPRRRESHPRSPARRAGALRQPALDVRDRGREAEGRRRGRAHDDEPQPRGRRRGHHRGPGVDAGRASARDRVPTVAQRHARLDAPITLVFRDGESNRSVATFVNLARSIARRWNGSAAAHGRLTPSDRQPMDWQGTSARGSRRR